jgi:phosphorylase kinase alpha/beta subunit
MKALHQVLETMRLPNGTYVASPSKDYSYVWIRDTVYAVLPYLTSRCGRYEQAFQALLDLFRRYEWKIDIHIRQKPVFPYEFIHARYSKELTELEQPWGHAQNDAVGLFLWGIGAGVRHGQKILRDDKDRQVVQKLVQYLSCLEYWQSPDNGIWEEYVELHASSIGACVAGLRSVRLLVDVPNELIEKGEQALHQLLPRESESKDTDLALLSLIYPFQIVSRDIALQILENVADKLERTYGCIRYEGDRYYNEGAEAEWCFGFPWLGLCYSVLGEDEKAEEYWAKTRSIVPPDRQIPDSSLTPNHYLWITECHQHADYPLFLFLA